MSKTGFIIGAGAGVDYGLPTGTKLRQDIINSQGDFNNIDRNHVKDLTEHKYKQMCEVFSVSNINSIDKFLKFNDIFELEGKVAISRLIKVYEYSNYKKVFIGNSTNWIHYLYNQIFSEINEKEEYEKVKDNNLYFCTFNYDRLLEIGFSVSLYNTFRSIKEITQIYSNESYQGILKFFNIEIDHVYGMIGDLDVNKFHEGPDVTNLGRYYDKIRLINEREKSVDHIIENLFNCDKIYFLGYGFNSENNNLLNLEKITNNSKCFSTSIGLYIEEQAVINNKGLNVRFIPDSDCIQLLRRALKYHQSWHPL